MSSPEAAIVQALTANPALLGKLKNRIISKYGEPYYWALLSAPNTFKRVYYRDPVACIHDCIEWRPGEQPTKYQDDILGLVGEGGKVAVQSLHAVGKTTTLAWVILWFSLTRDGLDWKLGATASAWRQLKFYLFPEVRKWAKRLNWGKLGRAPFNERTELLKLVLSLNTGEAFAAASDNPGLMEGAHADKMAFLFDESKLVPASTFDAIEGAFAGAGAQPGLEALAVAASTPGDPSGRFYDICRRASGLTDWKVYRIRIEQAIEAKRVSPDYPVRMAKLWGVESSLYRNKVEGEFAAQDETAVIPLHWVEAANERYLDYCVTDPTTGETNGKIDPGKLPPLESVGADIADGGGALNVIAPRYGDVIANIQAYVPLPKSQIDTARRVESVILLGRAEGAKVTAVVDANGNGAGVYSYLEDKKYEPIGFVGSERTSITDESGKMGFANLRALSYWHLRELLNPERPGGARVALPPIPEITRDLTTPKWKEVAGAKILIESKEDIAKRQDGESTDYGDAITMAFLSDVLKRKRAWAV